MKGDGAGSRAEAAIVAELRGWAAERRPAERARALVLTGPAGVGKTHAATAALAACADIGLLAGAGKFAEGQTGAALAPIMAALSGLVAAAMRTLFDRQTGVASLVDALGVQLDVLIAAGFEIADVRPGRAVEALANRRGSATRITAAVLALLDWTTRFEAPRALLIDDWYRAAGEARQLLAAIAAAPAATPLMLVLTQREAAVEPLTAGWAADRVHPLAPLPPEAVRALLDARLGEQGGALATAILDGARVAPLPFDVLQAADALVEQGVLRRGRAGWSLDTARYRGLALDAAARIAALDADSFRVALALALWGDRAPLGPFRAAFADRAADAALAVLEAREIAAADAAYVGFRHDRLRRETLARADGAAVTAAAARLAEGLRRIDAGGEATGTALHLRLRAGLDRADAEGWRDRFAAGATAARNRGDAASANAFAEAALTLAARTPDISPDARRLILREALIAAADRDDPATEARACALIATSRTPTEIYADHEIGTVALRLAGRLDAAWALASEGLRRAGLRPPPRRLGIRTLASALRWKLAPRGRGTLEPGDEADAFTGMAAAAAHLAYHRDPRGTAIIGFDASRRSGRTFLHSPYWRSVDAFLFAAMGERRAAADAAEAAVASAGEQRVYRAATLYQATFFGLHWRHPIASQRPRYREIVEIAQVEGDLVTAAYAWRIHIMAGWRAGVPLPRLCDEAAVARRALADLGEDSFSAEMDAMAALLDGLSGRAAWDPRVWRFDLPTRNHVIDLELSNLAGDWDETVRRAELLRPLWGDYAIQADSVPLCFHETLARLRSGRGARRAALRFLREAAALNPADHRGKLLLIEAERARGRATTAELRHRFDAAVSAAAASDSRLDCGLALVCAADALRAAGEHEQADGYRHRAERVWSEWGLRAELHLRPAVAVARDQLAEAEARADAAERADGAKSRLLAHVGHELRTPLQTLQAALDLSAQSGEPVDMNDVRLVLGSLTRLVDDLDVIGGLAELRHGAVTGEVDLAVLVRSEVSLLRRDGIALTCEGSAARVDAAADRLRQIVRNLLSNAVKYGGGTIDVALSQREAGGRVAVELTVADRGAGVPEGLQEAIFRPFERGERAGDGRGVGIGLALSRQLAERLGGTLTVAARAGGGASFVLRLSLPVGSGPAAAPVPGRAVELCHTVLLIEDAPSVRRLLATVLTGAGYQVREAATAAAGIAAWHAHAPDLTPDLTIVDLGLPDASGLDVLAAIRSASPDAAVILLSAAITGETTAAAAADPRVRALRKPASAQSLQAAIAELFGAPTGFAAVPLPGPATDPLYAAARAEVAAQARAAVTARAAASPQALHRIAGTAAQFGWLPVATAVEAFAAALAADAGVEPAGAEVMAAVETMT